VGQRHPGRDHLLTELDRETRAALRRWLVARHPWIDSPDVGPRAVEAGECDRCGGAPRLVPLCGPVGFRAVCRDCALALADDGWCEGHAEEGAAARAWARSLPDDWADVTRLWWVATGEVRLDPDLLRRGRELDAPGLAGGTRPDG
jgi:hypothetical protein